MNLKYFKKDSKITSHRWSGGGTSGSCWNDELSTIEPGQPSNFDEFDNLLAFITPNLSFIQYKVIFNKCVVIESKGEGDYYGGYETYYWHEANLLDLLNSLKDLSLLTDEKIEELFGFKI